MVLPYSLYSPVGQWGEGDSPLGIAHDQPCEEPDIVKILSPSALFHLVAYVFPISAFQGFIDPLDHLQVGNPTPPLPQAHAS